MTTLADPHYVHLGYTHDGTNAVPILHCARHHNNCELGAYIADLGSLEVMLSMDWEAVGKAVYSPLVIVEQRDPDHPDQPTWEFRVVAGDPGVDTT